LYRGPRSRLIGIAYLAPAVIFVLAFTAYPLGQWVSFVFTLKYTAIITPILIGGGYLLALLTSRNSPLRRFTRTTVFIPVVIGLGVSSLLWYWLFSTDFGLVNKALSDLGIISKPVLWLGVDADRSMMAIITSVVWKVIGFGMILFMGAIQAIPSEINEASLVDGASYWQRVTRVILPLTLRTVLLVTLVSVIGSLLAFDQFYIMTAGQPQNETATSVFYVYLNSVPDLRLGYGAALSMILALTILLFTVVQLLLTRRSHG
jgi:multiple sugar transport system permease protein